MKWYAKAGLVIGGANLSRSVFGFGCARERSLAENSAKYECVEHLWGSDAFYTLAALDDTVSVYDYAGHHKEAEIERKYLLIRAIDSNGKRRNATGLALGSTDYDAETHAADELIERDLLARWWKEGELSLDVIQIVSDEGSTKVLLGGEYGGGHLAVAALINRASPMASFGSAYSTAFNKAANHAIEECEMLKIALAKDVSKSPRHAKLRETGFVEEIEHKLSRLMGRTVRHNRIPDHHIKYAQIMSKGNYRLVRAYADKALDITRSSEDERGPFL